jgi:predicted nucleic acid-binding protein
VTDSQVGSRFLVVDASVSLKWVLDDEVDLESSLALRDNGIEGRFQMLAPSLWLYEITNALVVAHRRDRIDRSQGSQALALLQSLGVRLADPEAEECFATAARYEISAYDAAYLALAEAAQTKLWTGDRKLYEKVSSKTERIRWIGDYKHTG